MGLSTNCILWLIARLRLWEESLQNEAATSIDGSAGIRQIGDSKDRGLFVVLNPSSHTLYGGHASRIHNRCASLRGRTSRFIEFFGPEMGFQAHLKWPTFVFPKVAKFLKIPKEKLAFKMPILTFSRLCALPMFSMLRYFHNAPDSFKLFIYQLTRDFYGLRSDDPIMEQYGEAIQDLTDLRQFVYLALCEQNDFEPGAFKFSERILVRAGQPCGLFFCLHGPRSVKLTAIWETDQNHIIFYGSSGERKQKTRLAKGPSLVTGSA